MQPLVHSTWKLVYLFLNMKKFLFLFFIFFIKNSMIFISLLFSFSLQALDTFNTAVVSPIYYVMFTSLTILASVIMFKVYL